MKRMMLQGSAIAIVIVVFATAASVGVSAIRSKGHTDTAVTSPDSAASVSAPDVDSSAMKQAQVTQAAVVHAADSSAATQPVPTTTASAPTTPPSAPFTPTIQLGESTIAEDVVAVRSDSDVVVSFDKPMLRTRRQDKFEYFLRSTLPAIYGTPAADAMGKIPEGGVAAQGDLLTELPSRGVRIPLDSAWMIRLFPETRPGQDGPLVIRYRARVVPIGS